MHAYNCICANVPSQIACIAALNEGLDAPQYMNRAYIERRNYLVSKLKELGFELDAQPEGAFYIFPSIRNYTSDDFDFCVKVLEEAHVKNLHFRIHRIHGYGWIGDLKLML